MIPMASVLSNSALANCSLSGGRRQALALMGGPLVVIKFGIVLSANSESNLSNSFVEAEMALR